MNAPTRKAAATAFTVSVLMASAAAREDLNWLRQLGERRFEFQLLAAADRETPDLPAVGWYDLRRLLKMEVIAVADELRLSVQAEGFAALQRVANRTAHLSSPEGELDLRMGFDGSGRALAVLADTPVVRKALQHLWLTLDEPTDASGNSPSDPVDES